MELKTLWLKFFNKSKHDFFNPIDTKFRYYCGTWYLSFNTELYWVHSEFKDYKKERPTYLSEWNKPRWDFDSMIYIMQNHPNLRESRETLKKEDKKPVIINS